MDPNALNININEFMVRRLSVRVLGTGALDGNCMQISRGLFLVNYVISTAFIYYL